MFQPIRTLTGVLPERIRRGLGRRATGAVVALFLEALLVLLLLALGRSPEPKPKPLVSLTSFDVQPPKPQPQPPQRKTPNQNRRATLPVPQTRPPTPTPPQPAANPPPLLVLPRNQNFDLANLSPNPAPTAPASAAYGPADTGSVGDSKRVGTAPDGSPLYGAAWYREPTDSELAAFGARAQGQDRSWGRIACKTAPDYRVEDCVAVDEYPDGSHLANAVLSAAWQFKVRPPWKGGHSLIGSWVQITIYNDTVHRPKYEK